MAAMSLADMIIIRDNLVATMKSLSAELADSVSMPAAQRSANLKRLTEVQQQIDVWEAKIAQSSASGAGCVYPVRFEEAPT